MDANAAARATSPRTRRTPCTRRCDEARLPLSRGAGRRAIQAVRQRQGGACAVFAVTAALAALPGGASGAAGGQEGRSTARCVAEGGPEVAAALRNRLEASRATGSLTARGVDIRARAALPAFYDGRGWQPAWLAGSSPSPCGSELVETIPLGWPPLASGSTLRPDDRHPSVTTLRARLSDTGDLERGGEDVDDPLCDEDLAAAVRRYQMRHGLDADGAVGARTVAALNAPVEDRVRGIEIDMERWRWLPDDLGEIHIRVNIAAFDLEVWEGSEVALEMSAVVGRSYRQTPVFTERMSYLVLAPLWHAPPGIARLDKLPEIQRDPGSLARQSMTLLDQTTNRSVDPATVDFASLSGTEFNRRYRLRQDPGPLNALGQVKFIFPNRHNVYLHDTPSRELFSRSERAFSSGCIRIERPLELAGYLLRDNPAWPADRVRAVAAGTRQTTVNLDRPVPVHLQYWTAFADEDDIVHFWDGIYQRDARVPLALDAEPADL